MAHGLRGKDRRKTPPLKQSMYVVILLCWVFPLIATLIISSYITQKNTRTRIEDTIRSSADHGVSILEERFASAVEDSRAVSYDGVIAQAYNRYLTDWDSVSLYGAASDYLSNQFSHNSLFEAVWLIYPEVPNMPVYVFNRDLQGTAGLARDFEEGAREQILARSETLGTRIAFLSVDGKLYMVRNLVNSRFETYAVLTMQCSRDYLFESAGNLVWVQDAAVELGDQRIDVVGSLTQAPEPGLRYDEKTGAYSLNRELDVENCDARLLAVISGDLLAQEQQSLHGVMLILILVSGVLLLFMVQFLSRNISKPVSELVAAMGHLEEGELGYHVEEPARSQEFQYLDQQFNALSDELKEQFERNTQEQIALHEARIKALQSQINPHFLNNTLELINWEARLADNQKVCKMIEALSVMLNAAMARGGRATVSMTEELSYIDAYLYIISQRFGSRLTVKREISPEVMSAEVPRLILQPIVENAIEHGISHLAKGELLIRLHREGDTLVLDVENNGTISPKDREAIDRLLSWDGKEQMTAGSAHIGIRNVNLRLKILCGPDSGLTLEEIRPGYIRSRIRLPFHRKDALAKFGDPDQ